MQIVHYSSEKTEFHQTWIQTNTIEPTGCLTILSSIQWAAVAAIRRSKCSKLIWGINLSGDAAEARTRYTVKTSCWRTGNERSNKYILIKDIMHWRQRERRMLGFWIVYIVDNACHKFKYICFKLSLNSEYTSFNRAQASVQTSNPRSYSDVRRLSLRYPWGESGHATFANQILYSNCRIQIDSRVHNRIVAARRSASQRRPWDF